MTVLSVLIHHVIMSLFFTTVTWFIYLKYRNMSIIDITWGIGFSLLILYDFFILLPHYTSSSYQLNIIYPILIVLICLWSLRLSFFLFLTRIKKNHLDHRYESMKQRWASAKSFKVLINYWFQGLCQASLSIAFVPLLFSTNNNLPMIPIFIVLVGIIGESLADYQLMVFKKTSTPHDICRLGLWKFSRHPNYFFDIVFWLGVSLYTFLCSKNGFVFVCPILLYIIMRFITGRISETISLGKKGHAYQVYQESTFMIFPKLFIGSQS